MKLKFNFLICLLFPLISLAGPGDVTYKKTITKEFQVNAGATFSVNNKYGKINFHSWNKNEVKAVITVTGYCKRDDDAQAIANMVDIVMDQNSSSAVALRTSYSPPKSGSSWFSWGRQKESNEYVNIDYEIYLPQNLKAVKAENQFGDIFIEKFTFPAELILSYGTYDIREAEDLQLKLSYCEKGKIGKVGKVILKSSYSNMRGERLESMELHSSYSEYVINSIGRLTISCTYDDLKLEQVGSITGTSAYTDVKIGELQQEADLKLTYGDVSVKKVAAGFKGMNFLATYADVKAVVARKQPLQMDIKLLNGDLRTGGLELRNVISNKTSTILNYTAQTCGACGDAPNIRIRGTNADVKMDVY